MPKFKENNIRRKDGQTLCVGHKMIVRIGFYITDTFFSEFTTQRKKDATVSVCLSTSRSAYC